MRMSATAVHFLGCALFDGAHVVPNLGRHIQPSQIQGGTGGGVVDAQPDHLRAPVPGQGDAAPLPGNRTPGGPGREVIVPKALLLGLGIKCQGQAEKGGAFDGLFLGAGGARLAGKVTARPSPARPNQFPRRRPDISLA